MRPGARGAQRAVPIPTCNRHGMHLECMAQWRVEGASRQHLQCPLCQNGHQQHGQAGGWLPEGMAVTCDHRIRSLATTNKKTGFGSLVTTKCGHLRPQNVTFADRANKTSTVHAVTCDHTSRSLATKNWDHLASLGSLVPMHGVGGVGGGGWDDNVPCTCTHTSRTHHLYPCTGWVGWVGWDDNVPCTCTHTSRTHHLYPCTGWVGGVG